MELGKINNNEIQFGKEIGGIESMRLRKQRMHFVRTDKLALKLKRKYKKKEL